MKLSILLPVYNERTVVERCISLVLTAPLPENMDRVSITVAWDAWRAAGTKVPRRGNASA